MKVFLGGTCSGYDWRSEFVPLIHCDWYNPIVEDWTEEDRQREVQERESCDYVLYAVTQDMAGVYSIAEVVDDSNKRPEKTLFVNLYKPRSDDSSAQMARSLLAVESLLASNGVRCFNSLQEVADLLNAISG